MYNQHSNTGQATLPTMKYTTVRGGEKMEEVEVIKAVQKMQDYIEQNIQRKITLKELAVAAGYSP